VELKEPPLGYTPLRTATSWFGFPWRNSPTSHSPPASPRPRPRWPPLQADASGYRALNATGRAFGRGTVRRAWIAREGESLPEELTPWSSLLQESFRRCKAPLYLIAQFTRRATPLLLPLRRR